MDKNLVTIMTFSDESEARVCQGQLKAEGIGSFLRNADAIAAMPLLGVGLGGYQLQVDLVDKKKAEELIIIKS